MHRRFVPAAIMAALIPGLVLSFSAAVRAEAPTAAKAYLGVLVEPMPKDAKIAGAMVREVTPDSPAAKAGLKKGDVIDKVASQEIKGPAALVEKIAGHKPGDKVALHVMRDGKDQEIAVTLGTRPEGRKPALPKTAAFLGVWAQPMTPELKEKLGTTADKGAVVKMVMPLSPAAKAGVLRDDVITAINDQAVAGAEELRGAVQKIGAGKEVTLKVLRGKDAKEFKIKLEAGMMSFDKDLFKHDLKGFPPELQRRIEEMQKRLSELEDRVPAK
jgi:S1-C subfamily serine protease